MKVTVLGAGAWGTALAKLLVESKSEVTLWSHRPEQLIEMGRTGRSENYLPGVDLPQFWILEPDLQKAAAGRECLIVAIPSRGLRAVTEQLKGFNGLAISVAKGIEYETGLTMCGILAQTLPHARLACLSGPSFALEVARSIPTAIVAASKDPGVAVEVQRLFHRPTFRVYTSEDQLGVELGGALKNVMAIAAGACDGLGFGDNSKAGLVTRAIAEMRRVGVACGANPETFSGLSGLGDLALTCFSRLSRNRSFGERIGRGEHISEILSNSGHIPEGYPTARSAYQLARRANVDSPIIDEVYAMLYTGKNLAQAIQDLISRDSKPED